MPSGGSEEELREIDGASTDVAADDVRVHGLQRSRIEHFSFEDAVAKTWCEALDL